MGRMYHVQTEDSGVENPHIFTHLFFQGLIISSARTDYEPSQDKQEVQQLMKQQQKLLMKQLVGGKLDAKIVQLLGGLEPGEGTQADRVSEQQKRIRSYHHQMTYNDRVFSIQTHFYATVVTDVFFEKVMITSHLHDCREQAQPGGDEVKKVAQEQHKNAMRQLRDGVFDDRIKQLLGSLSPQADRAEQKRPQRKAPLEVYRHRINHHELSIDVCTSVFPPEMPHIITEILHEGQLVTTAEFFNYEEVADEADALEFAQECGKEQHTSVLKQLTRGQYDELIRCVVGDAFLDFQPTTEIKAVRGGS